MIVALPADFDMIVQSCLVFGIGGVVRDGHDMKVEKKAYVVDIITSSIDCA